ncbi:hypothetical protein Krac_2453 [Ktedonobacter racemifer DSM 44963]|uniref:Uncharacterized protein n=1 Tax=Ktedonobacter racemifer DSM 44963 TaxID=485913 RepID=D6U5D3_KTERA|nr:hypothetical protein Krac_2453 [Ktedonobacter racemifer DSM 44963]
MKMSGVPSVGRLYMTKFSVAFLTCFLSQMANFQGEQFKKYDTEQYQKCDTEFYHVHIYGAKKPVDARAEESRA